jgi:uncharacterized membrane-anchored protein YitT (DUF2179 family)
MERAAMRDRMRLHAKDLLLILVGSTITTCATKYFFDPAGLVTGGVSGLAIIIKFLTRQYAQMVIPLWLTNLLVNIPIFLFAWRTDGFKSIIRTGISWLITTLELAVFPEYDLASGNLLLVSIYGGICFGAGTGLLLMARATSGGTDMLGNSLHRYFRQYGVGRIIQILDGIVVILGAVVFNIEHTLYALISVYIMGKITDWILARGRTAKCAMIISDCSEEIARDILYDLSRGVTSVSGTGMYSGAHKNVLICICSNKDIVEIKDIVRSYDPKAFFIVNEVTEAMGEGFVEKWN